MRTPNKRGIINRYNQLPEPIRQYFGDFDGLIESFSYDILIGYLFSLVELAHNMTIYCGVVKLHKVTSTIAHRAVDSHHMKRDQFRNLFTAIFEVSLNDETIAKIESAQKTRNKILHGKTVSEADKRNAIISILEYAEAFNEEVSAVAGFRPFGSLQGFRGRAQPLDKSTSRWVLKGIGLIG